MAFFSQSNLFARILPWLALAALMTLCLLHGLRVTADIATPPDLDALRDIGFAQGLLDGNWFGDPVYRGATRYYPPLVPALGAAIAFVARGADLPWLWMAAGPWLGLLPVAAFFIMLRRLFPSDVPAICGTACVVLWNGLIVAPWVGGGYSPWLFTPVLTQAAFLGSAWLIHARIGRARWWDAVLIGLAIGLTFDAHVVPALLLTGMLVAAAWAVHGPRGRMLVWLALAGSVQLAAMLPYLLPLLRAYPQGIVHVIPGGWSDGPFKPGWASLCVVLLLNLPGLLGGLLGWRLHAPIGRCTTAMLASWMFLCLAFLTRHVLCQAIDPEAAACRFFQIPVHHFHLYLQLAGACLVGWGAWAVWRSRMMRRDMLLWTAALLVLLGVAGLARRDYDNFARGIGLDHVDRLAMDRALYRWVLASTPPDALFITAYDGSRDGDFDPAAFAVMAAGRKLMATHILFSNPYLDWTRRDAQRQAAVAWLAGKGTPPRCTDVGGQVWAAVGRDVPVLPARAVETFRSGALRVYRVNVAGCTG